MSISASASHLGDGSKASRVCFKPPWPSSLLFLVLFWGMLLNHTSALHQPEGTDLKHKLPQLLPVVASSGLVLGGQQPDVASRDGTLATNYSATSYGLGRTLASTNANNQNQLNSEIQSDAIIELSRSISLTSSVDRSYGESGIFVSDISIALMGKSPSVPKGRVLGAAPTASGLQVRCAGRPRLHRCECRHMRLQMSSFYSLVVAVLPLLRNSH